MLKVYWWLLLGRRAVRSKESKVEQRGKLREEVHVLMPPTHTNQSSSSYEPLAVDAPNSWKNSALILKWDQDGVTSHCCSCQLVLLLPMYLCIYYSILLTK